VGRRGERAAQFGGIRHAVLKLLRGTP